MATAWHRIPFSSSLTLVYLNHLENIMNHFSLWLIFTSFCFFVSRCFSISSHFLLIVVGETYPSVCCACAAYYFNNKTTSVHYTDVSYSWWLSRIEQSVKNLWIFYNKSRGSRNKSSTYRITIFSVFIRLEWIVNCNSNMNAPQSTQKTQRDSEKYYLNILNIVHTSLSFVFVVEHLRVDFVSLCHVYIDHSRNCVQKNWVRACMAQYSTEHHICKQMNEYKSHNLLLLLLTIYCLWNSTHTHISNWSVLFVFLSLSSSLSLPASFKYIYILYRCICKRIIVG